ENISEMDDWNRTRSETIIYCEECRLKNSIEKRKLSEEIKRHYSLKKEVELHFEKNYYSQWEDLFSDCKTKKDMYNFLVKVEILDSSVPQKYFVNKYKKIDIPKSILDPETIKKVLKILK